MQPATLHPIFLLLSLLASVYTSDPCTCLNGGTCANAGHCLCPPGFIGETCNLPAQSLTAEAKSATISTNYSYFFYQPNEINYYRLSFNICMLDNPLHTPTLFYIETQRNNGSLRAAPSLFQTAKLVLGDSGCTTFTTHYISIKRREDNTYRRIVVGLRAMEQDDAVHYLNIYRPMEHKLTQNSQMQVVQTDGSGQQVTVQMHYEVYLQTSYYGSFIIILTASVLLLILMTFVNYLRKRYTSRFDERITQEFREFDLSRFRYYSQGNPERESSERKNNLASVEVFMPVTRFGKECCYFVPETLTNCEERLHQDGETCSICLIEFQHQEEVRTTPCKHLYHRDCIDNWCETNLSCPICRRELNFSREIRKIYYHFLRGELLR